MGTVYIAEAMRSEKDNDKTGWGGTAQPGDQLQTVAEQEMDYKGEVRIDPWRSGFTVVFRYKDRAKAKAHVEAVVFFCNSLLVGYNQSTRLSLKNYVKSLGYANYKKIAKKKECDCSSLQCLCSNIAGVSGVKDWNSDEMIVGYAKLTDDFETLTDPKYLTSSDYLMEGDILVKSGHAACSTMDGPKANYNPDDKDGNGKIDTLQKPKSNTSAIAGTYEATEDVNMRYGPGSASYDIITVLKTGEKVTCDGSYTDDWYYVKTTNNVYGFVKKTYLKLISSSNSGKCTTLAEPKSKNSSLAGKYVATEDVNMRYGPSSNDYEVIRVVKKGEVVNNYGYYTSNWLYVKDSKNNKGYINKAYLKKK